MWWGLGGRGEVFVFWSGGDAGSGTSSLGDPGLWKEGEEERGAGYRRETRKRSTEGGAMEAELQSWGAGAGPRSRAEESAGWGLEAVGKSGC